MTTVAMDRLPSKFVMSSFAPLAHFWSRFMYRTRTLKAIIVVIAYCNINKIMNSLWLIGIESIVYRNAHTDTIMLAKVRYISKAKNKKFGTVRWSVLGSHVPYWNIWIITVITEPTDQRPKLLCRLNGEIKINEQKLKIN